MRLVVERRAQQPDDATPPMAHVALDSWTGVLSASASRFVADLEACVKMNSDEK